MTDAERAYEAAEREIERVIAAGETYINLGQTAYQNLVTVPKVLSVADTVTYVILNSTQVHDLTTLRTMTQLEQLDAVDIKAVDFSPISSLINLRELYLDYTYFKDLKILRRLKKLDELSLQGSHTISLAGIEDLFSLRWLDVSDTDISEVLALSNSRALRSLNLSRTHVADVSGLSNLKRLQDLNLNETLVDDLRPLVVMRDLAKNSNGKFQSGLRFQKTKATERSFELAQLSIVEDDSERTKQTFAYLDGLEEWPPRLAVEEPVAAPDQEPVLKVDIVDDVVEVIYHTPSDQEVAESVKQKLLTKLREEVANLAAAAGNYHPRLAKMARDLLTKLECDLAELDLMDVHLLLDRMRGLFDRRTERTGEDVLGVDVVDALDAVISIGPGLVLDNDEVEKLEARRLRYRQAPHSDRELEAQDHISASIEADDELFGDKVRAYSTGFREGVSHGEERALVGQSILNKNVAIRVASHVALQGANNLIGIGAVASVVWLATALPWITILAEGWGASAAAWFAPILNQAREAWEAAKALKK